jgi:2-oxoglutarate ferredoxin oxidoreductase subunit alpha
MRDVDEIECALDRLATHLQARLREFDSSRQLSLFAVQAEPIGSSEHKKLPVGRTVPSLHKLVEQGRRFPTIYADPPWPYENEASMIPAMANFGEGYRYHVTGLVHDQTGFPTMDSGRIEAMLNRLHGKLDHYADEIIQVEETETEDAEIGIVCYGSSARSARQAMRTVREEGIPVGMLRIQTMWPFPTARIHEFAGRVSHLIVPELNLGQIAHEVEHAACGRTEVIRVNRITGDPIPPEEIVEKIKECR